MKELFKNSIFLQVVLGNVAAFFLIALIKLLFPNNKF